MLDLIVVGAGTAGCVLADDGELRAKLDTEIQTVSHPTSTCRMGEDAGSVVDPRPRGRGVAGLWAAEFIQTDLNGGTP